LKATKAKTSKQRVPQRVADQYERRKERERERQAKQSAAGRDIDDDFPGCQNKAQRKKCDASFKAFCLYCFAGKFKKEFSPDHLKAIAKIEASIIDGLLFALSMPRGSGKTTLIVCAVLWAILSGRRRYIALIGPTATHATKLLRTVKVELECNDQLMELYPEACYPVRRLQGIANRCRGQMHAGKRTYIEWGKKAIVLATIPGAACSGALIEIAGMTGSIRGMQHTTPTGETLRPDCVIVDDPQTKRSAKSDTQVTDRLETIQGDILGLAGPGEAICGFMLCTVIRKGDVADQLLDREAHPEWQGERFQLVYAWPTNEALWDEYARIRAEELSSGRGIGAATEFYIRHQKKMDAGSQVGWEARYKKGEASAIQHAYNLLLQDEEAFWCEYQNEPRDPDEDSELLTVDQLMAKHSGYLRGVVHPDADTLTAFIDVQGKCLYWMVVAWRTEDFTGWIVDYGTWPDQGVTYFTLAGARSTLAKKYPRAGIEGRIKAGLVDCIDYLIGRVFETPNGDQHRLRRVGVDAAWGTSTKVVQDVCRTHDHAAQLMPCFGRGITTTQAPIESWRPVEGERRGLKLLIRPTKGGGRHMLIDTNYYKTFVHNRFATADGDRGSLCFPKPRPRYKTEHKMPAEHCRVETRKHVITEERRGDVWTLPAAKPDNHFFDCLCNCTALATVEGVKLAEHRPSKVTKKKKKRGYAGGLAA
jgi:hypothetical protein